METIWQNVANAEFNLTIQSTHRVCRCLLYTSPFVEETLKKLENQKISQPEEKKLVDDLTGIINGKLMQEYQLSFFYKDYFNVLEQHNTIKKWSLIRSLILKNIYNYHIANNLPKISALLGNIIDSETNFYNVLFHYLKSKRNRI